MVRELIVTVLLSAGLYLSHSLNSNTISGSQAGMVPNDVSAAQKNADILANLINKGYAVRINRTFYIGESSVGITSDLTLSGTHSGKIILTGINAFKLECPVSIEVTKLHIACQGEVTSTSVHTLFLAEKPLVHKNITFSNLVVEGVRLYSQKKKEGYSGAVGVSHLSLINSRIISVGRHLLYMGNCVASRVLIKNNSFSKIFSVAILLGLGGTDYVNKNDYFDRVIIQDNSFDGTGFVLDEAYPYMYYTPILIEANSCECVGNTFKNLISLASKRIALYSAYLNCNRVVFNNNTIFNCINLGNSTYNEVFKCKSAPTKGEYREITNNSFTVTRDLVEQFDDDHMPSVSLIGLQTQTMDTVILSDNKVDVACDFVFGATTQCEYKLFQCEENEFNYHKYGKVAKQMIRLRKKDRGAGEIIIRNNKMTPQCKASDVFGLFAYESDGYMITIENNQLSGALPYGDSDGVVHKVKSLVSRNNIISIGSYSGAIRISHDMVADDIISGGKDYQIRFYPTSESSGSISWRFVESGPYLILPVYSGVKSVDYEIKWISAESDDLRYLQKEENHQYTNNNCRNSSFMIAYNKHSR